MKKFLHTAALTLAIGAGFSLPIAGSALADEIKVTLSGGEEVPPVKTTGTGSGTVTINADMTVSVSIKTTGVEATAAHIHMAPAGQNGPVIVPFTKNGDTWVAAPGAKLTEAQYAAYKAGGLYVNVHSPSNKGGEVRAQIKP